MPVAAAPSLRSLTFALAFALCTALSAQEGQGGSAAGPLASEKYKDIQVLNTYMAGIERYHRD